MRKWIDRIAAALLGFVLGMGLATLLHLKERWVWDLPSRKESREIIHTIEQEHEELEAAVQRLRYLYIQIQEDWGRILEKSYEKIESPEALETNPK